MQTVPYVPLKRADDVALNCEHTPEVRIEPTAGVGAFRRAAHGGAGVCSKCGALLAQKAGI